MAISAASMRLVDHREATTSNAMLKTPVSWTSTILVSCFDEAFVVHPFAHDQGMVVDPLRARAVHSEASCRCGTL